MAELVVLVFADEAAAERALEELQRLQHEERALTLEHWELVVREADDRVVIPRSSDAPRINGGIAVGGGVLGLIIGGLFLAPLAGLMVGSLLGATLARRQDTGVDEAFAAEVAAAMQPGSAALLFDVVAADADLAIERLKPFAPRVVRTTLTPEDEATLRARLEGAAAGTRQVPEPEGVLDRKFGRWYPTDFVVALVDDGAHAERVAAALASAGFPEGEVAHRESEQVLEQVAAFRRQEGRIQRTVGRLQEHLSTEGDVGRRFREAAERGAAVVAVRAETPERVAAAGQVLREQGARDIHHFGRWTVTDLSFRR